jgi:HSP20 family protein
MTVIRRGSPFGELLSLRRAMDRLVDDSLFRSTSVPTEDVRAMPLDVYTTDDALVVEAVLPAVKPDNVDISILGDTLTLTATTESERNSEEGGYYLQEVQRGRFSRAVTLPGGLKTDAARATFENGLLRLSFPKAEQTKPRQIPISGVSETRSAGDTPAEARTVGQGSGHTVAAGHGSESTDSASAS